MLKNKKTPVTTASRKPLFLEKRDNKNSTLKALKINQNQNNPQKNCGLFYLSYNTNIVRTVRSVAEYGTGGLLVDVECHLSNSLPGITIVGFANKAVDEAKDRVRSAFAASNLSLPRKKITINLAPADLPKDSTSFDLGGSDTIDTAHISEALQYRKVTPVTI